MAEQDTTRQPLRTAHVAALVHSHRFDEALRHLYEARDARPDDLAVTAEIRAVRERQLRHGLERLGSLDAIPRRLREREPNLGTDCAYVFDLVRGVATVDELLDRSTLGRHRTVRALVELLERVAIELAPASRGSATSASVTERVVVVADGNRTQSALTRTMLRLALGATARMHTVESASELLTAVEKERPALLVVEFTLPGSDGLAAMRAARRAGGTPVAAIVVVQRIELAYVETRLPEDAVALARPIDKGSLFGALETLGVASARGRR